MLPFYCRYRPPLPPSSLSMVLFFFTMPISYYNITLSMLFLPSFLTVSSSHPHPIDFIKMSYTNTVSQHLLLGLPHIFFNLTIFMIFSLSSFYCNLIYIISSLLFFVRNLTLIRMSSSLSFLTTLPNHCRPFDFIIILIISSFSCNLILSIITSLPFFSYNLTLFRIFSLSSLRQYNFPPHCYCSSSPSCNLQFSIFSLLCQSVTLVLLIVISRFLSLHYFFCPPSIQIVFLFFF